MKKVVSVILAISILMSLSTVAFAAVTSDEIRFAVVSDTHVATAQEELVKTNEHPLYWYANRRAALDNESRFILESFLKQCENDSNVDFVLIPGDVTDEGKFVKEEHELAAGILRDFEERTGKQVYVINGNHDISIDGFMMQDFKEVYADLGYDKALDVRENDCSYTADLGDKYRLIALDSCAYNRSTGDGMTEEKICWVEDQATIAKRDGRYPILMMHHNLLDHMPIQSVISKDFIIANSKATAERFANAGIKLVFTGHEHCSDATSFISSKGNKITDFANTALSMYPITYRLFRINDERINYYSKEVESIDTVALNNLVKGYTPEILDAMNEDFNAFAKGYLKKGIEYRLALGFTPEKMGIAEGAIYYDLVMNVVGKLTEILEMPLYGENSVQELAKKCNLEIPESSYENGWDLATELVAAHYEGGESLELESTEVVILLRTIALILREEFVVLGDELYVDAATAILVNNGLIEDSEKLKKLGETAYGNVTPAEYLLLAIVSPILYNFAMDDDGVDDNTGVLIGYGVNDVSNNKTENFVVGVADFTKYLSLILNFLSKVFNSLGVYSEIIG